MMNYLSAVETMSGDCRGRRCRSRYVLAAGCYKAIQYQDQALRGVNLSMWTLLSTNGSNTLEKPDYGFLWFQFATMINGQNMIKEMLASIYEEINLVKPVWSNRQYVVILPGLSPTAAGKVLMLIDKMKSPDKGGEIRTACPVCRAFPRVVVMLDQMSPSFPVSGGSAGTAGRKC